MQFLIFEVTGQRHKWVNTSFDCRESSGCCVISMKASALLTMCPPFDRNLFFHQTFKLNVHLKEINVKRSKDNTKVTRKIHTLFGLFCSLSSSVYEFTFQSTRLSKVETLKQCTYTVLHARKWLLIYNFNTVVIAGHRQVSKV